MATETQTNRLENGTVGQLGHALMTQRAAGEMTVFDKISDPLAAVDHMGKWISQAGLTKTEPEGKCVAFASLCKKMDPVDIIQRFHLMDGKFVKKADVILADFNSAGGKHRWIKTGDDGIKAEIELKIDGETLISDFSIQDAQNDDLVERKGSRWKKGGKAAGEMMRARCVSRGVRMLRPAIVAGMYTPEEVEDMRPDSPASATTVAVRQAPEEIEARRKELLRAADPTGVGAVTADPNVVDVEHAPAMDATIATTTKPADDKPAPLSAADLQLGATIDDIIRVAKQLGMPTRETLESALKKANPTFVGLEALGLTGAENLLANLKAKVPQPKN